MLGDVPLERAVRSPCRVRKPVNGSVHSAEAASGARVLLFHRCCGTSGESPSPAAAFIFYTSHKRLLKFCGVSGLSMKVWKC